MGTQKRLNFIVRYSPSLSSINGILFSYLKQQKKEQYSARDRILKAVSVFWMPFAAEWMKKDEDEQRTIALSSIYQLESHIQYIREQFDIPQPQIAYIPKDNPNSVQEESDSQVPLVELETDLDQDDEFGGIF